ncbi:MAG: hypothetical protein IKA99_03720, partial [Clostridia bacterium]|nr:hypothetical protein [Clostridia bacterium]
QFCERNNLISMSGTDYHDAGQPITGGIIIPENIDSNEKLVEFLFNEKYELIQNKDAYIQGYYDIRQRTKCNFLTY